MAETKATAAAVTMAPEYLYGDVFVLLLLLSFATFFPSPSPLEIADLSFHEIFIRDGFFLSVLPIKISSTHM